MFHCLPPFSRYVGNVVYNCRQGSWHYLQRAGQWVSSSLNPPPRASVAHRSRISLVPPSSDVLEIELLTSENNANTSLQIEPNFEPPSYSSLAIDLPPSYLDTTKMENAAPSSRCTIL